MRSVARGRMKNRFDRWDRDGLGGLRREDFEREARHIAAAFGADPEAPEAVRLREALRGLFDLCADQAGVSPDAAISEVQFLKVSEDLIFEQGEAAFNRALRPVAAGVIGVCDRDGDGRIDRAEFVRWLTALGLDDARADEAFEHVAGGTATLGLDELLAAIRDYHYGRLDVELIAG
ncbi:EF-hand domain-containing protein [Saccharopolyspora flava]|uniref:Ca2+-binding protein, EF-hand superfamily n=1 Tax=Saccharopolyspora flava TaxID=95161 RepID=A0A1I6S8W7_9PSEU|nr:EF-hand domain-containing protein [Saccharopolyspora flava]SFS73208.1 Ca2+-binding protein, EF-hand superfamily [Saccharopolyspora flava]